MPPAPARLTSTKLVVEDLEAARDFYCRAYGFVSRGRIAAEMLGEPIDEFLLGQDGVPGVPLMLMKYLERPAPPVGQEVALVFASEDLDALFERVVEAGGSILAAPFQSEHAPVRAGFSADPEGHVIENIEVAG